MYYALAPMYIYLLLKILKSGRKLNRDLYCSKELRRILHTSNYRSTTIQRNYVLDKALETSKAAITLNL